MDRKFPIGNFKLRSFEELLPEAEKDSAYVKTDILVGQQNEDACGDLKAIELLVKKGKELRCLVVAASGDLSFTLASLPNVKSVDATDILESQIRVCELRRAALLCLDERDLFKFVGFYPSFEEWKKSKGYRISLYERVRENLSEEDRVFWDGRKEREIAHGNGMASNAISGMHCFMRAILSKEGMREVDLQSLLGEKRDLLRNVFHNTYSILPQIFGLPKTLFQPHNFADNFSIEKCVESLERSHNNHPGNFYVANLQGYVQEAKPVMYDKNIREGMLKQGIGKDRIRFHLGTVEGKGAELKEKVAKEGFDFISTSNIHDMTPPEKAESSLNALVELLSPGGVIVLRRSSVVGLNIAEFLKSKSLSIDPTVNQLVRDAEKSFTPTANEIVVAQKPL